MSLRGGVAHVDRKMCTMSSPRRRGSSIKRDKSSFLLKKLVAFMFIFLDSRLRGKGLLRGLKKVLGVIPWLDQGI